MSNIKSKRPILVPLPKSCTFSEDAICYVGLFDMPDLYIENYPPIAEMIYLKTLSVSILDSCNEYHSVLNLPAYATEPFKCKNVTLNSAREEFSHSPRDESMY